LQTAETKIAIFHLNAVLLHRQTSSSC